jgi:ankyrin repeat protein
LKQRHRAQLGVLRFLVKELGAINNMNQGARNKGRTALHLAAMNGRVAAVRCIIKELSADVNRKDSDGWIAMQFAACSGHADVMLCMAMEFGVDVHQTMPGGRSALFVGAALGHVAVVRCMIKELGADVNQATHKGGTPLFMVAKRGFMAGVQCLVSEGGADVNQASYDNTTPVFEAAYNGHLPIVAWLLSEGGVDISMLNLDGESLWSEINLHEANDAELAALLRIMVLLADPPAAFLAKLSPAHILIAARGALLRAAKPSYVEQQRALIADHCPLPAVLLPCVVGYAAPTHEDMWTDWAR